MAQDITIINLNPNTFELQEYSNSDTQLIAQSQLDTVFNPITDYIEYYIYDQNQNLIYPSTTIPLLSYDVREGDVILNPQSNLEDLGYDLGIYNILYTFYRKRLSSDINQKYFISEISSDRTEIRLDSNIIDNELIISSSNSFIQYREEADYFVDFYLNFGENQTIIANNFQLDTEENLDPTVLIKLYEPLPSNFNLKDELWIVEELSSPQAYQLNFPFIPIIEEDFTYIAGPNYSLNITQETSKGSELFSFDTLLKSDVTSSINQIKSLLNQKEVNININYEKYENFVNFSSAQTRLENFYYKVGLIEATNNQIIADTSTSNTANTFAYSSSKSILTGKIDNIIKNFDGYEYFLYFNSGSQYSYPKQNTEPPFQLYSTGSTEALNWVGSADPNSPYYGGQALSASNYDQDNKDWLQWSIPEYLREDPQNRGYELFVDMVSQYYDNVWVYTKDISNKFDADNRLDYGISKDLVADAIKDFGVKLYSSNFNNDDLFTAFLGLTPSGSLFPFPNITSSLPTETGFEYVDTQISASNDIVPLNGVQKQVYKRVYHNIPYLLKTKGTIAGLRALITSYGIPDTILRVNEFGGKDKNESQDYDLEQNIFNYAFNTGPNSTHYIESKITSSINFGNTHPKSIQLRFKTNGIPSPEDNLPSNNIRYSQSIWHSLFDPTYEGGSLVLEYTGSGLITGSYSGSIPNPYDTYGTLKFIPSNTLDPNLSASVYLPFFDGDWWSVQMNIEGTTASLYSANNINNTIGFNASSSTLGFDSTSYNNTTNAFLNSKIPISINSKVYEPFSGSFQEYRFWNTEISQSKFYDYVTNPNSAEGNSINSTPDQLYFRADLGSKLDIDNRLSIHPRVTGSEIQITQSFTDLNVVVGSSFRLNGENWVNNIENIYQDQVPVGIKNRITDKIQSENLILAESPYGFQTPTSSQATISNEDEITISPLESIQQTSYISQSYTPNINYLEVAFSPTNQINDDINAQLGYFNLGDYIGDPRFISSSDYSYPNLDRLRDAYFEKYIKGYDIVDFIRLIKFFDNSLFKMIKDFTPARTSLASGVVVKQHLLERNRQRPAQVTSSLHDYEGLVVNLPKNYTSGSLDFPQYSTSGSAIYKFSGGTGGSFERFNSLKSYISGSDGNGPNNRFFLTQSWQEDNEGSILNTTIFNQSSSQYISGSYLGPRKWPKDNQSEFYDGIFSGSTIIVTDQDLNPDCEPYLNISDDALIYQPLFFSTDGAIDNAVVNELSFLTPNNYPISGYAWISSRQTNQGLSGIQQTTYIKLSKFDKLGNEVSTFLNGSDNIRFIFGDAQLPYNLSVTEYKIQGITEFANHVDLTISLDSSNNSNNFYQVIDGTPYYPITSSNQGGSMNWSLETQTSYTTSIDDAQLEDTVQQGVFLNVGESSQEQNIFYWNSNSLNDALNFFNTGSEDINTNTLLSDTAYTNYGSYNIAYTPNIPWFITASISYSSSIVVGGSTLETIGLYHSHSSYQGAGLTNQNFVMPYQPLANPTTFIPSPLNVENLSSTQFETTYNTQIPGNEGSGTPLSNIGGHPKIKLGGTASMDWYFPSLTLNGTPTPLTPTPRAQPLSGSSLQSGPNPTDYNGDFTGSFVTTIFDCITFSGSSLPLLGTSPVTQTNSMDGNLILSGSRLVENIEDLGYSNVNITSINLNFNLTIVGDGDQDFGFNMVAQDIDLSTGNEGPIPVILYTLNSNPYDSSLNTTTLETVNDISTINYSMFTEEDIIFKFTIINNKSDDVFYDIDTFSLSMNVDYTHGTPLPSSETIPPTGYTVIVKGNAEPSTLNYQSYGTYGGGSDRNLLPGALTTDFYPKADIDIFLKRTGSEGEFIITGSQELAQSINKGSIINFTESPILNIEDTNPALTTRTLNIEGDLYYIEYSMSNYQTGSINGLPVTSQNVAFETNSDLSLLYITQSTTDGSGGGTFDATGNLRLRQSNINNPNFIGNEIVSLPFTIPDGASINTTQVEGNFTFDPLFNVNDIFRFSLGLDKIDNSSGLVITAITASILPSQSIWSPLTSPPAYDNFRQPGDISTIIPTFYGTGVLPFNLALDCQPLLNNYSQQRSNTFIMDVDYNDQSGPIIPVNQEQILDNTAVKADVPDSNYTQLSNINPRYNGVKSTSQKINIWSIGDEGTYGKNPTLELRDAFFGYFNDLDDPYPNINGLTRVNLNYLIDEQGNALPPSLSDQLSIDTFQAVFPNTTLGKFAIKTGNNQYTPLSTPAPIERITQYVTPICYSQNSGDNYSNSIPLSGSGYISRYDNDDATSVTFGAFTAAGTSSIDTTSPTQTVSYTIDPSEAITIPTGVIINPWSDGSNQAAAYTDGDWGTSGEDLDNEQIISLNTSFVTSYVSETNGTRDELTFSLKMFTGSADDTQQPFNLESIDCKVYTTDNQVYLIEDVDDYGWFTYQNIPTSKTIYQKRKRSWFLNRWKYTKVEVPGGGIVCQVDWEMFETLFDLGLIRKRKPKNSENILALEWIINANSGKYKIKSGDRISWKIEGEFKNASRKYQQGLFFPLNYSGKYTPAIIQGQGTYDHLLDEANKAQAPFWVFTGSAGGSTNILDQSILVMSSSNFNEAYGPSFYQGDLDYYPGSSQYFPGNIEPKGTNFDRIEYPLEIKEGDEFRFGNNENFTYRVIEVFAPSENVEGDGKARLKVKLDKPVDSSINKDFFLVRRPITSPRSLYLDTPFPYGILASASISQKIVNTGSAQFALSGSIDNQGNYTASYSDLETLSTPGILYPDFPTEYLIQSASLIVNTLISKGIIES